MLCFYIAMNKRQMDDIDLELVKEFISANDRWKQFFGVLSYDKLLIIPAPPG